MKKLFILFMLFISILSFSMERPDYIINIKESEYDKGDYTVSVKFKPELTDDLTLQSNFANLALALKYAQEQHPKGKWFFSVLIDEKGNEMVVPKIADKLEILNLINDKEDYREVPKKVLSQGNVLCPAPMKENLKRIFYN